MRPPPPLPKNAKTPTVYSVGEVAHRIKSLLEKQLRTICIEGEISGLSAPASGHKYFALKDSKALINAAWFKRNQQPSAPPLSDGMHVKIYGDISAYSQRSEYQLIVHRVEPAGEGALQQAYEALKKKLAHEGLFDPQHKKTLPYLPKHIGIITSPTGAVIRDMTQGLTRRFPHLKITLAGVPVQGPQAAPAIQKALEHFNETLPVDLIILGRGGGSLEDLWAFNEENLARAVYASTTPIISAVGHEPDFSICDFVADHRASTPSAAAEIAVPEYEKLSKHIHAQQRHLVHALEHYRHLLISRFIKASESYVFREPAHAIARHRQELNLRKLQLTQQTQTRLEHTQQHIDNLQLRLTHKNNALITAQRAKLNQLSSQLNALSHQSVLERGYSITRSADGTLLRNTKNLKKGDPLRTELASGVVTSMITTTEEKKTTS